MKVLRKFAKDHTTIEFPDEVTCTYDQLPLKEAHIVSFKGETWEWVMHNQTKGTYEAELLYTPTRGHKTYLGVFCEVIGPLKAFDMRCQCGASAVNHPAHSPWCNFNKNGWDEAIKEFIDRRDKK